MKKKKFLLALILFCLGALGILSMLTMEIPIPEDAKVILESRFSAGQIKWLLLVNPTFLLVIAIVLGTVMNDKVALSVPLIEKLIGIKNSVVSVFEILKYGVLGGLIAGVLLSMISFLFVPMLPAEFLELGEAIKPSLIARFLYGGITEELLMRFGLMTTLIWLFSKIMRGTKPMAFYIGISIAAVLFALGHFPVAYQAVETPSAGLLSYILIGNSIGGLIFGWLYWKKGLESAMIGHMVTHVVMVCFESYF